MGRPDLHRTSQTETAEVHDALDHLHRDPKLQAERERHLEALSEAQGGRWLESSTVAHEGSRGYGQHSHHSQAAAPEVKAALEGRQSPEFKEADEKLREARAAAQGGRWVDSTTERHNVAGQMEQPEVQAALAAANEPAVKEEMERKKAARAAAQGGRWLD